MTPKYSSAFLVRVTKAAERQGATVRLRDLENGRLIELSRSGRSCFFAVPPVFLWPFNRMLEGSISRDKELTNRLLSAAGLCVPETHLGFINPLPIQPEPLRATSLEGFIKSYPVVLKPNDASGGEGVLMLYDGGYFDTALDIIGQISNTVLLEAYVPGRDVRLYALRGEPLLALERPITQLYGDGLSSVRALLNKSTFYKELEHNAAFRLSRDSFLRVYGAKVFAKGEPISLYPVTNFAQGTLGQRLIPHDTADYRHLCQKIYQTLNLDFFALDLRQGEKISVIEVNANPGVSAVFETSAAAGEALLEHLIDEALDHYSHRHADHTFAGNGA